MRFTPAALSLAVLLAVTSSVGMGQRPDPVDARSMSWATVGDAAFAAGRANDAIDAYEAALVIDPRNGRAFMGMATVAKSQGLPGKAIRYYDEALKLDAQNVAALQGQGLAMLDKGAVESARGNLARITAACKTRCAAADTLSSAITAKGAAGAPRMVSTSKLTPVPEGRTVTE